ncbi:MAG: hypothetical protein GVY32_01930 [Gammaproteobacteria bacterium]|jgi:TolB-like protein|nr:hypothetical protein [Gammaproteobacteria bacterium]
MSLWTELKRRNVFRIAAAYVVIGWLMLQVADIVLGFTGAPDWVGKALIALLLLGFVPVLALAWVFEVGPEGIRVDDGHSRRHTGPQARRLDLVTLGAVVLVVLLMVGQHLGPSLWAPASPTRSESPDTRAIATPPADPVPTPDADPWDPPRGSIAALPFANRSAVADNRYFVDGIHDELLTELARNANLTVISRTSVMEYADTTMNLREIGRELGVANILEGAVQRAGEQVRITVQLIDAASDAHLWADTYDRRLTPENLFAIQTEIAAEIASALGRQIAPDAEQSARQAPTGNAEAYDLFLQARGQSLDMLEVSIRARMSLYEQALGLDPAFAAAMGELGREHINLYWFITRRHEDRTRGGELIDRALALQGRDPRLRLAKAEWHYRANLDYGAALSELNRAASGLPGSAEIAGLRAYIKRRQGEPQEALALLQDAALLDPRAVQILNTLVETYWLTGDLEQAERWQRRLGALPEARDTRWQLTYAWARFRTRGDVIEALMSKSPEALADPQFVVFGADSFRRFLFYREYERAERYLEALKGRAITDQFEWHPLDLLRARLALAGAQPDRARLLAETARERIETELRSHPGDYRLHMANARALALLGRGEAARAAMHAALDHPVPQRDRLIESELRAQQLFILALVAGSEEVAEAVTAYLGRDMRYWGFDGLMRDPAFDRHRDHPAFKALAAAHTSKENEG